MIEAFGYSFMQVALLVTVASAVVCALLSCWIVLVGWSLMGDAVSHAVLPGVVLAYVIGWPFAIGALAFAVLAVSLIGAVRAGPTKEDTAIGLVFTSLFALGLVLISVVPSQIDLGHILFGNVLGVSDAEVVQVVVLAVLVSVVLIVKRRDLVLWAFDPAHAHVVGMSPRRLTMLLLGLLAVTTVVGLQAVGVVLVVAMLIIPGATARLLTERFTRMLVLAPLVAVVTSIAGLAASFHLDVAPGGMIVLGQAAAFALAYLAAPRTGLLTRWRRARETDRLA